jgi:hypothetical protein
MERTVRDMLLNFEERLSDSPFVERIWRTHSEQAGDFTSMALSHWQMCVWTREGKTHLTVRGPETKATIVPCPPETEFLGIVFKLGTFMPDLPASRLIDGDITLPETAGDAFRLKGALWEFPIYENADIFLDRLVREGMLVRETVVDAALQGYVKEMSLRSVQRRFVQTIGLTHSAIYQIERARQAVALLQQGVSILDTVEQAGYFDQPHLTKAMKHFIGQTPAQLLSQREPTQLSYFWQKQPITNIK